MFNSGALVGGMATMERSYPTGLTTFQNLNMCQGRPKGINNLNRTLLSGVLQPPNVLSKLDEILSGIDVRGTSEVDVLKINTRNDESSDDLYEYDIVVPLPPPNRRYKVKLNITSIKKAEPTIVGPDWL